MRGFQPSSQPDEGRAIYAPLPSDHVNAKLLGTAGTPERDTIPAGAKFVAFSSTADFYAKFGAADVDAAVPGADVTNGSGSELNPALRTIPSGAVAISLVSPITNAVVTLSYYG